MLTNRKGERVMEDDDGNLLTMYEIFQDAIAESAEESDNNETKVASDLSDFWL